MSFPINFFVFFSYADNKYNTTSSAFSAELEEHILIFYDVIKVNAVLPIFIFINIFSAFLSLSLAQKFEPPEIS